MPASLPSLARRWQSYAAVAVLAALVLMMHRAYATTYANTDFEAWWNGSRLWLGGLNPYSDAATAALVERGATTRSGFAYPFPVAVLSAPLAALPYSWALTLWGLASLGAAAAAPWLLGLSPRSRLIPLTPLLYFPIWAALEKGQWGPILLLVGLLSLRWQRLGRPFLAGLILPLALLKPQTGLALLLAVGLVAARAGDRRWWAGLLAGFALWWGLTWLLLPSWPLDWLGRLGAYSDEDQNSVAALAPAGAAVLAAALWAGWRAWRLRDDDALLAAALVAGLLLLPSRSYYNQSVLLLPLIALAARRPGPALAAAIASWGCLPLGLLGLAEPAQLALAIYAPVVGLALAGMTPAPRADSLPRGRRDAEA